MKRIGSIVLTIIMIFSTCSCSSNERTKLEKPSSEAQAIMESLKPDDRIDDYLRAYEILSKMNINNEEELKKGFEELIEIDSKYTLLFKEKHFSTNYYTLYLDDLNNNRKDNLDRLEENMYNYYYGYFSALVLPVYCEKKTFEKFLPTSFSEFEELSNKTGYLYEDDQSTETYSKKYYQYKLENSSSRGDYTIVHYDSHGNVGSYFFRLKKGESWTTEQFDAFSKKTQEEGRDETAKIIANNLKNLNIKNNSYLKLTYNDEEINKIQNLFSNINEKWIQENNSIEWYSDESTTLSTFIGNFSIGETTLTVTGSTMSDITLTISTNNFYYDKYHKELNVLKSQYINSKLDENEQELSYKSIDEVLSELSVSQTMVNNDTALSEDKNIQIQKEELNYNDSSDNDELYASYYERPIFSENSDTSSKINLIYDDLETLWTEDNTSEITKFSKSWEEDSKFRELYANKYQNTVDCKITFHDNNLISITQDNFRFLGDMHGINLMTSHTFNTRTGNALSLGDILCIDGSEISEKITNEFSNLKNSSARYTNIDLSKVRSTLNINSPCYLSEEGLCIYYNPYEVASYSAGSVEITIPYSRTDLIKPIETLVQ